MKFPKEVLQELIWGSYDGYETVTTPELYETSRWSNYYSYVFRFEGKLYETTYSVGASDSQDESPYEYEDAMIECPEVEAVEVLTTVYKPVTKTRK